MSPKSSDTGVEDDSSEIDKKKKKRHKRKEKKHKKKRKKHATSDSESENDKKSKSRKRKRSKDKKKDKIKISKLEDDDDAIPGPSVPVDFVSEAAKARVPMTKEQWEKSQSIVRRIYDEETGRSRLVKGDGEILEEIVSKERHREINRQATIGDGLYFQSKLQKK